jgi:ABC-type antimicrobial peptide transport system permease subunit
MGSCTLFHDGTQERSNRRTVADSRVQREVLVLTAAGLLTGYAAARFTTHFVESFLFGVKSNDPLAMVSAIGILLAAAMAAGYAPAWRASQIDPAAALRSE